MSHTNEPWVASDGIIYPSNGREDGQDWIADCRGAGNHENNARRIVACVNACAGMATEYLESMAGLNKPIIVSASVIKERNELLTTLETVARNIASSPAKVLEESVAVGDALQRLDRLQQHIVPALTVQRDELLAAAKNLRDVKGRHHSEQAFNRLVEVIARMEAANA